MYWVLQQNLYNEEAFQDLLVQLERQDTPYKIVKIVPFIHEIDPDVDIENDNVFVCGSTGFKKIATKKNWIPGYIDENIDVENLLKFYGDRMLNKDAIVSKLKDVKKIWDTFFIRPCSDKKQFAGMVMNWDEFQDWQQRVIALDGESTLTTLTGDDKVIIAPIQEIYAEYRFFVVDGVVVTGSRYKVGKQVRYNNMVDQEVQDFAQRTVNIWQPNRAFCLDIADTPNGYRVIEINSLNSSGFYNCDMGKFVAAINAMEF